jgi:phage terminase small subunit
VAERKKRAYIQRTTAKRVQAMEDKPYDPATAKLQGPPAEEEGPWVNGLSDRQKAFCEYYVGDAGGNAALAAQMAGYPADNRLYLAQYGLRVLKRPFARAYIGRLLTAQGITPDFLRGRLAQLAHSSLENFVTMDDAGDIVVDLKEGAKLGAVGQLKELREEVIEGDGKIITRKRTIKVHDPLPAIRTLAEMLGILVQQHNHTLNGPKGYVGVSPDDWDDRSTNSAGADGPDPRRN